MRQVILGSLPLQSRIDLEGHQGKHFLSVLEKAFKETILLLPNASSLKVLGSARTLFPGEGFLTIKEWSIENSTPFCIRVREDGAVFISLNITILKPFMLENSNFGLYKIHEDKGESSWMTTERNNGLGVSQTMKLQCLLLYLLPLIHAKICKEFLNSEQYVEVERRLNLNTIHMIALTTTLANEELLQVSVWKKTVLKIDDDDNISFVDEPVAKKAKKADASTN